MIYQIKRIEAKDNIANITQGFALVIPEYRSYDLLFGLTLQRSDHETLRLCKYDPIEGKILYKNNIDFIKSELKAECLAQFADKLEELVKECPTIWDLSQHRHLDLGDSSLFSDNKDTNIIAVYSIKYYEGWNSERHIGFCFFLDNSIKFRIFRVDKDSGDTYSPSEKYGDYHRAVTIAFKKLRYPQFINNFTEMTYELTEVIEEVDTNFSQYPKYLD